MISARYDAAKVVTGTCPHVGMICPMIIPAPQHCIPDGMNVIRKVGAYILLTSVYGSTWLLAALSRMIPRRAWKPTGRIMVTGTFHNPNWYLSHITPLTRSGIKELILVVDEVQLPLERVRFVCPPKWLARFLSRAGAKAIWMLVAGLRYRPDLYMGYHLGAGPCSALIAGKLLGRPSCYQMTGGPVVIIGGGVDAIGSVGGSLGRPSRFIEALAVKVIRQFELVIVRGNRAKEFLAVQGIEKSVAVITGSVNGCVGSTQDERDIHIVFVGRLSRIKQVRQFVAVVEQVARELPSIRAAIVGEGPLLKDLQDYAKSLGLTNNLEFMGQRKDVAMILARSKTFVLTSKSEGLSIAMAEAMSVGTVPVVADIGELSDLVIDGVNGYLIEPGNIEEYASKAVSLLQNEALWMQFSARAQEAARKHCDVEVISEKWKKSFRRVISKASGCSPEEILNHEWTRMDTNAGAKAYGPVHARGAARSDFV